MAKSPAQRKADQRKREAAHLEAVGAVVLPFTMYQGTTYALERIMAAAEIEQKDEAITAIIHHLDRLRESDLSLFDQLTNVESLRKSA